MKYRWPLVHSTFDRERAAAKEKYTPLVEKITSATELYGLMDAVTASMEACIGEVRALPPGSVPGSKIGNRT